VNIRQKSNGGFMKLVFTVADASVPAYFKRLFGAKWSIKKSRDFSLRSNLSVGKTPDELQTRPNFADGADFYIDKPHLKAIISDLVFIEIGRHFGGFFWPRHPKHTILTKMFLASGKFALKIFVAFDKNMDEVKRPR